MPTPEPRFRSRTGTVEVETAGFGDVVDITSGVWRVVTESGVVEGIVCIANPGSTAGITTLEFEPGAVEDLKEALEKLAPRNRRYHHDDTWEDGNGFAHLRSALVGASRSFPVTGGAPALGTWQQVVLLDFDNRPRRRRLVVSVVGT
jgi:secondary thiamine-phosphate synthase enzyme